MYRNICDQFSYISLCIYELQQGTKSYNACSIVQFKVKIINTSKQNHICRNSTSLINWKKYCDAISSKKS